VGTLSFQCVRLLAPRDLECLLLGNGIFSPYSTSKITIKKISWQHPRK
jgi:hypothetical protein